MADSENDGRSPVRVLRRLHRQPSAMSETASRSPPDEIQSSDWMLDELHRMAADMLNEPVPERLMEALRSRPPTKRRS